MRDLADSIIDAIKQGRVDADFFKHRQPEKYFIGSTAAKHRVPRAYPPSNPMQGLVMLKVQQNQLDVAIFLHHRTTWK